MVRSVSLAAVLALLIWAAPARAVIKVDTPVRDIYRTSRSVWVGGIAAVDAGRRAAEVRVTDTVKGAPPAKAVRIVLASVGNVWPQVAVGGPVVVFLDPPGAKGLAVFHLADTWLLARAAPGIEPPLWQAAGPYDAARGFPGRTAALVSILGELKAGRPGIQDWISHEGFLGGIRKVAELGAGATAMTAAYLNGDGQLDLVVCTRDGVRLLLARDAAYVDATKAWGLSSAATRCAAGDVDGDGRPDLLAGDALWHNAGGRLVLLSPPPGLPKEADWLAAALADVTGDGRADAVVLQKAGRLVVCQSPAAAGQGWMRTERALWPGAAPALAAAFSDQWGDDGKLHVMVARQDGIFRYAVAGPSDAPADFRRLTGVDIDTYKELGNRPLKVLLGAAFDYEGNGKTDFLLVTQGGGIMLANRGYGAFLINRFTHRQFDWQDPIKLPKLPVPLADVAAVAAGRVRVGRRNCQDLLVLTRNGALYEMDGGRR